MSKEYNADSIKILRNLESVRQNPSMYLGDITSGDALHDCAREILDNSVDEFMAGGFCDSIEVTLHKDNSLTISDNGRGIPVDIKEEEGVSALQVVMCNLAAGGKFDNESYKISSGLHGIGASAVNAVSEWLKVEVRRDDKVWFQEYERGIPKHKVKAIGQCTRKTGTKITFKPDEEIFKTNNQFQPKKLLERIREVAYLNVGLEIIFVNELDGTKEVFKDKEGLASFIRHLRKDKNIINDEVILISHNDEKQKIAVDIALQWTDSQSTDNVFCYSNNVFNSDGGTHMAGFRSGINKAVNKINEEKGWVRGIKEGVKVDDSLGGLFAIVSIKMPGASYASQTKSKLINSEVKAFIDFVISEGLYQFCFEHPKIGKSIVSRIALSAKAREEARKARERVFKSDEFSSIGTLPGKLADCSEKDPSKRELYIVEGSSAAGSAKQGRDRHYQAIYALRGKPLNCEKQKPSRVLESEEIRNILTILGVTISKDGILDSSDVKYHHVSLLCDADSDGAHIQTILLTLFFRYTRNIIENGFLYLTKPPLFRVQSKGERLFLLDDKALEDFKKKKAKEFSKYTISRFKGCGEMNPDELAETVFNKETRRHYRVTIGDAEEADKTISMLMGSDSDERKKWLEENAVYAKNLDI